MINFRYHVVSLTAVFLALAIGLIVGTAALNGPLSDELKHQVTQLSARNQQYRAQVNDLNDEVKQKEQFADQIAPLVLAGKLTGRRVLVVSTQNSNGDVKDLEADLQLAGAKVTGHIETQDSLVNPTNNEALLDLAAQSLNTTEIPGLPANSDGVETSTALLAAVLMDHQPPVPAADRTRILNAYANAHYINVDGGQVDGTAEAVVVLAGLPYTDQEATQENQRVVTMVDQFDKAGPIVVGAASTAGNGNVISAVRGDASLKTTVSSVDNDNTPQGLLAVTLALNEQVVYGRTGHYGLASNATALLPKLPES
ncbi:MAG TPA: copper transporter [Micromonosporaceae bacterium]|nr:copper transporter [Micromonosporaceae bacterium]